VHQGDGLAPVALSAEYPVAKLVIDRFRTKLVLLKPIEHCLDGIFLVQTVEEVAVHMHSILGPSLLLYVDFALEYLDDGQAELLGELPVAGIVGGNRHNCAGTVTDQDIVGNPNGNALAVYRVDRIAAAEDTGLFFGKVGSLKIALACA